MRQEREIASLWGRSCFTFLVKSEYDYDACVLLFRLETVSAPSYADPAEVTGICLLWLIHCFEWSHRCCGS